MVKKIGAVVALLLVGLLGYAAIKPPEYEVSRELLIQASAAALFPHINNSQKTAAWMPWAELDPQVKMTFSGPSEGVGSVASWDSPGSMGTGKSTVTESVPQQKVLTAIEYAKPMQMTQVSEMSLTPSGTGTVVRWKVSGKNSFIGRLFCLFVNMDKEVGGHFERGLARLKTVAEAAK